MACREQPNHSRPLFASERHPLRVIRAIVDEAIEVLSPQLERICANTVDTSIAPEKLLRSLLLEAFYTIRSERELIEQRL